MASLLNGGAVLKSLIRCIFCVSCCVNFLALQEFKGYIFKIMGDCDKQGFPMKQGVLTPGRVRLLLPRECTVL
ncbi:hypothetical protein Csa_018850 [Cucumis sativus]|nr:hypothetical protein Csa_018850 [Cucumis sativus]